MLSLYFYSDRSTFYVNDFLYNIFIYRWVLYGPLQKSEEKRKQILYAAFQAIAEQGMTP